MGCEHIPHYGELLRGGQPQFVVACVSWDANPGGNAAFGRALTAILSETPPAEMWRLMKELCNGRPGAHHSKWPTIYHQPHHACRLAFARSGLIGA
jgi:hypothetical protein